MLQKCYEKKCKESLGQNLKNASVEKKFRVNHATQKARISPK